MAKLLLGKEVNASINEEIKAKVETLKAQNITPTLGIIRIGEREDDIAYERGATKRCETLGVAYEKFLLPADVTQEELMATIDKVNKDDSIHGVLIFRPLPKHLDEAAVIKALSPEKDVDGITDGSNSDINNGLACTQVSIIHNTCTACCYDHDICLFDYRRHVFRSGMADGYGCVFL